MAATVIATRGLTKRYLLDVMVPGEGPSAAAQPVAILLGFAPVLGLLAAKFFRWED